jgi:hypothetical protein
VPPFVTNVCEGAFLKVVYTVRVLEGNPYSFPFTETLQRSEVGKQTACIHARHFVVGLPKESYPYKYTDCAK